MKDCKNLPSLIASAAERTCRMYANTKLKPIGEIAKTDKWFDG